MIKTRCCSKFYFHINIFTRYVRILTVQVLVAARLPMNLLSPSLVNLGEREAGWSRAFATGPNTPRGHNHDDGITKVMRDSSRGMQVR